MKYLITGGCGFLGSNLASEVIKRNQELIVFDDLSRIGSLENLKWLKSLGDFKFYNSDIRIYDDVKNIISETQPDVIFHLAGQVAMTTSIIDPKTDFEINFIGSFNVLEAARKYCPNTMIFYSSTNKVYGDLENFSYKELKTRYVYNDFPNGFNEEINLSFHSPYGCSKGSADQYFLDYYRIYGLKTVVFRHSSMYGGNQYATSEQGWIGWFISKALEIKNNYNTQPFSIAGNGKQVRDVLYSSDMNDLYLTCVEKIENVKGEAFNIGGGVENSLSLIELFKFLETELKIKMNYKCLEFRESDQKVFISDISKINKKTGWKPKVNYKEGLINSINWVKTIYN